MFKKGLVTLVCLTVMSALWAWAATTYSISTKITSIGTVKQADGSYKQIVGGDIKVRGGDAQTYGIKYNNFTTQALIDVVVDPIDGYKISALTATGPGVDTLPAVGVKQTDALTVKIKKPSIAAVGTAAWVVATFAPDSDTVTVTQNWQLQVLSNTKGGRMMIERATDTAVTYTTFGKSLVKSYVDTTPVKVTVTPDSGWDIDYLIVDGKKTFYKSDDVQVVNVNPAVGSRIKSVVAGFKKQSLLVTTQTEMATTTSVDGAIITRPVANGIEPANPVADPSGTVRLVVTPTGSNNKVTGFSVTSGTYATITYADRYGKTLAGLPPIGPVKVTITGITTNIAVAATYGIDYAASAAVGSCTNTCHLDPTLVDAKPYVKAAGVDWAVSKHAAVVDCVGCHQTMPGPQVLGAKCASCHTAAATPKAASFHGAATGHKDGTCQRCHTGDGARQGAETGWTGGYADVLSKNTYTAVTVGDGVGCNACHNSHDGSLLGAKTIVAGALVAWNPNGNTATNDQYDVCTSCHTLTDNAGALVGNYHDGGSINVTRTISDSHFDNPATGAGLASNVVEGYVLRKTSANPCADCHNLHGADLTVQEAWAESAHAGKIAAKKDEAARAQAITWFNATYPTNAAAPVDSADDTATVGTSTRTVLSFFQRSTAGVDFYKTTGALDDADGNAWTHYNWDQTTSRGACQRCHTATGISNFLSNPAGYDATGNGNDFSHLAGWTKASGSAQQELLYCWGCHSDSQSGALRNPGAITEVYAAATTGAPTATVAHSDFGKSNVCMGCHLGRQVGQNVKDDTDADGIRSFLNSHYLAAGLTVSGKGGYEFAGQSYSGLGFHKNVGVGNAYNTGTDGPCVTCHMNPGAESHTFEVSAASTACANCHGGLTTAVLEESKHEFHLALEELNTALKANGIYFYPAHPYFYAAPYVDGYKETGACTSNLAVTNWNKGATNIYKAQLKADGVTFDKCVLDTTNPAYNAGTAGTWKDVMGAAFNYNLLDHEPGAYAHNRQYSLKLIQDSIDYLADGAVNGVGASAVVAGVMADDAFAKATSHAAAIVATATPATTCADCHTPAPHYGGQAFHQAQYVSDASQPVTCANCHGGPANQAILVQYAESAHAAKDGEAWIHFDWRTTNRSACARCHNGTAFVAKLGNENNTSSVFLAGDILKPGETLACTGCHADAATGELRTASEAFTFNITNGTDTVTAKGASALCVRCHSGRETGKSITADADATGIRIFADSHYQPAAATVYNKGYDFGQDLTLGAHKNLGETGQGPCVTCHMPGKNHSFAAAACGTCHDGTPGKTVVDAAAMKADYDAALNNLKLALEAKGIHYGPVHPFFFTAPYVAGSTNVPVTNWGAAYGAASWKHTMGAAYNYNMLWSEKGAYAHNYSYAMKLIADSIDFMTDGALGL